MAGLVGLARYTGKVSGFGPTGRRRDMACLMTLATWLPGQQVTGQRLSLSMCSFCRTGSAYALVMSQEIFGCAVAGCTVRAGYRRSNWT